MITIKEEKIAEMMFDIWHESDKLKNPVMVGEYIANKLKKAINYTHCCESDSELLVCDDNELDCPYEFTSRCTMGRCGCKPKAN